MPENLAKPFPPELFETLFRHHQSVMLVVDPDSLAVLDANNAALAFYGWGDGPPRGMSIHQLCADGPDRLREVADMCTRGGNFVEVCRHRLADGSLREVEVSLSCIDTGGRAVFFSIIGDVTGRVQAERALIESEARLRSIADNAQEGIFQCSPQGLLLWANPAFARMLGFESARELLESQDAGAPPFCAEAGDFGVLKELLERHGTVKGHEARCLRRDGRPFWFALNAWTVRDAGGGLLRIEGVAEDVTSRRQAEAERMLLVAAVEQSVEGVAITGPNWMVEYVNPAFRRITGLDRAALLGKDFFGLFTPGRLPVRDIQAGLSSGKEWAGTLSDSLPGAREFKVEAVFCPIRDSQGGVVNAVVMLRDVSHQDRLERRLRRARRLEAVGTLASGIAHDFNNILTPILLNAEVGIQLLEQGDILRKPLGDIITAGVRARQLVKQLLAFSRRGELRAARMDLRPLLEETVRVLRQTLPPNVEARLDVGAEPVTVMADPSLVQQIVTNLADNALHSMRGREGTLGLTLDLCDVESEELPAPSPVSEGRYARLRVSDTGHGMDKSVLDRIFTPFFTTKRPGEGTGMGLSTVHGIVRSLGGAVRVESRLGAGSTFEVLLPLAGPAVQVGGQRGRALVVDAQAFSRQVLAMHLRELGYRVTIMRDGPKALAVFRRVAERFDVVLAGEDLSGLTGWEFLSACRGARPETTLILLAEQASGGLGSGIADAVLQKPVDLSALAAVLHGHDGQQGSPCMADAPA